MTRDASKGAANADISLLEAMRELGHHVDEEWDVGSPRFIRHHNSHLLLEAPLKCRRVVERKLAAESYDAVIINQPLGWMAGRYIKCKHRNTIYVARSHGWEPRVAEETRSYAYPSATRSWFHQTISQCLRHMLEKQNEQVTRYADGIIVCSKDDRQYIVTKYCYPENRVQALPPGLPAEFLSPAPREYLKTRTDKILYVGQYTPVKSPEAVAEIFNQVLNSRQDTSATWVCAKEDHERVRHLLAPGIISRVSIEGWMNRQALVHTYDNHGIYIFPSLYEGYAQTFLEAMSRGLTVLASNIDGMSETITDSVDGFLFEKNDVTGMVAKILELQDNAELLVSTGRLARETALKYTWPRAAGTVEKFLRCREVNG